MFLTQEELEGCSRSFDWFLLNQEPGVPGQFEPFLYYGPFHEKHRNDLTKLPDSGSVENHSPHGSIFD